jgi:hypothetical protein
MNSIDGPDAANVDVDFIVGGLVESSYNSRVIVVDSTRKVIVEGVGGARSGIPNGKERSPGFNPIPDVDSIQVGIQNRIVRSGT